jgi:class 3 adenylate cyclase/ActR/RegA family two-component response regulator/predicted metal-dependent HD superfamily phosphohydrolase
LERFINILIIDDNLTNQRGLKEILNGSGNNVLMATSVYQALAILKQKEVGILLINIDSPFFGGIELLQSLKEASTVKNVYKIVLTENSQSGSNLVKGLNEGAIDFIQKPFNPNLVKAKIEVYKALYYKDQRIGQLLENIFPENVLLDLNTFGKFSPKRVENGVVLFTDFVGFSQKSRDISPLKLLKKLEFYFTKFDEITERYKLEKIKTIGDSYMALAGVTENAPQPEIRACLAAIEMRNFMINEREVALAMNKDFWEIRIGIHAGPLVAGIIGTKKFSFDVWGDTVNIASRAEQESEPDKILITQNVHKTIEDYFETTFHGNVEIKKRGGIEKMFFLDVIKNEYCLYNEGKVPNKYILQICDLPTVDFQHMQKDILNKLKSSLPEELIYHDLQHTANVEKAAIRFAKLEGLSDHDLMLLRTAVYYHDAGFLVTYHNNETFGIKLAENNLPQFGYSQTEINIITKIIAATKNGVQPETMLEKIMCDADHDYFGRADYAAVSNKLRTEMENVGESMTDLEWLDFQLNYIELKHEYYTETARNIRDSGKKGRIQELKIERNRLLQEGKEDNQMN